MQLVFYISTLTGGGAERVVANLANAFAGAGHTVSVVTVLSNDNEYSLDKGVRRYVLEKKTSSNYLVRNIKRVTALRKVLKDIRPDLLISFMAEPNVRALIASRFLKIKTIVSIRNDPNREYASKLSKFMAKTLFRLADGIIFQTPDARAWFPRRIQERSAIIPNQVSDVFFQMGHVSDAHGIVAIGRLARQKNYECLIDAFSRIADQTGENLVIYGEQYGDTGARSKLEGLVKGKGLEDRVFLPGETNCVQEKLAGAKLYVLPSDYEGMPNSLLEAMAVGVPCIATDCPCGGPRMVIENGVNGILVPVGDSNALAEAILRVLGDEDMRRRLGENAKGSAQAYRRENVFAQWNDYFEQVQRVD